MLFDLFRMGSMDAQAKMQLIMNIGVRVFVIFCVLPIHEYAHALVAHKLGDDTARLSGRMTVAPMAHIDPLGALMILLFGFGYAKGVPVNMRNFRRKPKSDNGNVYDFSERNRFDLTYAKRCSALVALAGPAANLIMALICLLITNAIATFLSVSTLSMVVYYFFYFCASLNINLAVFNLIPIPPLDGSKILGAFLPDKIYYKYIQYERYIMIAVLILMFTNVLSTPISYLSNLVYSALNTIASLPFSFFN